MLSWSQFVALIVITIGGVAVAFWFNLPLAAGFAVGLITLIVLTSRLGVSLPVILRAMGGGIARTREVLWILVLVGLLIPAWMASGTIPFMVRLGLSLITPGFFLTAAFVLTGVIAMILGTSLGSLSTVGIPLMGVATVLRIPLPLVAGALVSGAFIGDRTSPLSSANRLVAASVGISFKENMAALLSTTIAAIGLSLLFFLTADLQGHWAARMVTEGYVLPAGFHYSRLLLLPPGMLIVGMLMRIRTQYVFLTAIGAAMVLGSCYQGVTPGEWLHYLLFGFSAATTVLKAKGLMSMGWLLVLIILTGAFNGILDETKSIQSYVRKVFGSSPSLAVSTLRAELFGLAVAALSCNQTLPIMIAGSSLGPVWRERFAPKELARVVADSALIFAGLIPWNMLAILCGRVLQADVVAYWPYAVFLWILPVLTALKSYWLDQRG